MRMQDRCAETTISRAIAMLEQSGSRLSPDVVEGLAREVISRLDERHRNHDADQLPDSARIDALCDALLSDRHDAAMDLVLAAQAEGMSADMLHLGYLAVAARELGLRWERDEIGFADVIIGAGRIYGILRHLREVFISARILRDDANLAAFVSVPGENHTLGVTMAADYMRRRGWQIDLKAGLTHEDLIADLGSRRYPVIGISAGSSAMIFPLARLILALRVSNPEAWIMVSGGIVDQEPDLANLVDADAIATDAPSADAQIESHMALLESLSLR
jgi:methanogenic corrinoid protein MtbC1